MNSFGCIDGAPQPWREGENFAPKSHLNILLVEDNLGDARLAESRIATCCGRSATVLQVDSLTSTLLSLAHDDFDVILLDLGLPDSEGLETVILILQQALTIPIIVLTSEDDEETALEAIRLGAQDYVQKSAIHEENLQRIIDHAIERHTMRLALERRISALERKRHNFRSLIADNADAMVVVDRQGIIRFANAAAETLMDRPCSNLVGSPFGLPIEGFESSEIELLGSGGGPLVVDMRVMQTTWEEEPAFVATLRDVTESKDAERLLRIAKQSADLASRIKSQFLANVSHELRAPLNSIIGFSELLLMERNGKLGSAKYGDYLRAIRTSGEDLLELIDRLLDLSKAQAGALEIRSCREDAGSLIESVIRQLQPQADDAKLTLDYSAAKGSVSLDCDAERVRQVLELLVSNSLKFTPAGGRISVCMRPAAGGLLQIDVVDTGAGMPEDQILRAFNAFDRPGAPYATEAGQGAGLGLTLAKTLIDLHGGSIRLESTLGEGTRVRLLFPPERVHLVPECVPMEAPAIGGDSAARA